MKLLAIDGNSILHRAFYGIKLLSNKNGTPTNAVFGFMNIYLKNLNVVNPDAVAVAFDRSEPTFRHTAVSSYKANRHGMPDDLAPQLPIIKKLLSLMGIKVIEYAGYEADDILGTLARSCSEKGDQCFILTGDRDSLQLISENVTVMLTTNKETIQYTPERFVMDYGFQPINLIDLKALMGDSSDNISGVAGIGEKTASVLIKEYTTIENLYEKYQSSGLTKSVKTKLEKGEKSARESKWLATICCDVPIDTMPEHYIPDEPDNESLYSLLADLEMFKVLDKLNVEVPEKTENFQIIETTEEPLTAEIIDSLTECIYILDRTNLSVMVNNKIFTSTDEEIIIKFLASPCMKSTDNAKPHYRFAIARNSSLNNLKNDVSICGYLLNASGSDYTIKNLCTEYRMHYYAENGIFADIVSLSPLLEKLLTEIKNENLTSLYENIEIPLIEVLASMEDAGVKVDKHGVEEFGEFLSVMTSDSKKKIYNRAGHLFNISSPKQLGVVLFEEMRLPVIKKTKTGYSTNADVLEELRDFDPIIENVINYRQYTKLNSTYVEGLLEKIGSDGRIHTSFKQTETRTGRISSTEPNMQNIPVRTELGKHMRKFFIADEGKVLVDADYSQIELRVMAHLCGDKNMTKAFNSGEDIHTSTASQVFDVPPIMVNSEMRNTAKAVNFGIIYGIGSFSLSKDINTSREQAEEYIKSYLERYPKVKKFMDSTVENAMKTGIVTTMFGRKRYIPEIMSSNKVQQSAGKRIAMNTPVQGTAADLIKIAMINVYRRLNAENLNARLILQVHDELIIESDVSCAERCADILREEMQNVYEMKVPLAVDVNKGRSWYDAKG
ncbi:MAG: DNA polymerase I [Ruminococcus flavefaciens]|nr:DNA polymerase I [Ruminococcus flavefaciens]